MFVFVFSFTHLVSYCCWHRITNPKFIRHHTRRERRKKHLCTSRLFNDYWWNWESNSHEIQRFESLSRSAKYSSTKATHKPTNSLVSLYFIHAVSMYLLSLEKWPHENERAHRFTDSQHTYTQRSADRDNVCCATWNLMAMHERDGLKCFGILEHCFEAEFWSACHLVLKLCVRTRKIECLC